MKKLIVIALLMTGCNQGTFITGGNATYGQEEGGTGTLYRCAIEAKIDTAYADPATGKIRPPCSLSPEYDKCMCNRGFIGCN